MKRWHCNFEIVCTKSYWTSVCPKNQFSALRYCDKKVQKAKVTVSKKRNLVTATKQTSHTVTLLKLIFPLLN